MRPTEPAFAIFPFPPGALPAIRRIRRDAPDPAPRSKTRRERCPRWRGQELSPKSGPIEGELRVFAALRCQAWRRSAGRCIQFVRNRTSRAIELTIRVTMLECYI